MFFSDRITGSIMANPVKALITRLFLHPERVMSGSIIMGNRKCPAGCPSALKLNAFPLFRVKYFAIPVDEV